LDRIKLTEDNFESITLNYDCSWVHDNEICLNTGDYKEDAQLKQQILDDHEKVERLNQSELRDLALLKVAADQKSEIKQLKEELKTTDELWKNQCGYRLNGEKREEVLKQILEKTEEWRIKNDYSCSECFRMEELTELKEILEDK